MKNVILTTLFLVAFIVGGASTFDGPGYGIGDEVSDFTLTDVDGTQITLSDYMGEGGAVVIFTCNTCPWAVGYEDRIIQMHNDLAAKGWPVLAINPNDPDLKSGDSYEAMQARASEKEFTFPYVFDEQQEIFPLFGATKTPHVFVVDKEMKVRYIGGIDDSPQNAEDVEVNYVQAAVEAIAAGHDPDPSSTKAIGCGIKYKKI